LKYATRSDSDIKQAVRLPFVSTAGRSLSLDVNVERESVVLGGRGKPEAKTSAEQTENIVGVTGADSFLKVRPSGPSPMQR